MRDIPIRPQHLTTPTPFCQVKSEPPPYRVCSKSYSGAWHLRLDLGRLVDAKPPTAEGEGYRVVDWVWLEMGLIARLSHFSAFFSFFGQIELD